MIKEDVLQYLKDSGYLLSVNGETIITNKFIRDIGTRAIPSKSSNSKQPTRSTNPSIEITKEDYTNFIKEAEVPQKINAGNGSWFWADRYSKPGFKAFENAIEEHGKDILLAATKYYYKQTNTARVMIGNFFSQGIYESFVDDVKNAIHKKVVLSLQAEDNSSNMEQG